MYKSLSLCIEGTHADDMPLKPVLKISTDVADMAVHLTEVFPKTTVGIQSGISYPGSADKCEWI